MPKPKNHTLRLAVPLILIILGIGLAYAMIRQSSQTAPEHTQSAATASGTETSQSGAGANASSGAGAPGEPAPAGAQPAETAAQPDRTVEPVASTPQPPIEAPAVDSAQGAPAAPPHEAVADASGLRALIFPEPKHLGKIGGSTQETGYLMMGDVSQTGAGLSTLALSDHYMTIRREANYVIQSEHTSGENWGLTPFAALAVKVTLVGQEHTVLLHAPNKQRVWRAVEGQPDGVFEALIVNEAGERVLRIERRYEVGNGSHELVLRQRIENFAAAPMTVRWYQLAQVDPPDDAGSYGGDRRAIRFGYILPPERDPTRALVFGGTYDVLRKDIQGKRDPATGDILEWTLWPNGEAIERRDELAWVSYSNRYFGVAVHALFDPAVAGGRTLSWVSSVDRVVLDRGPGYEVMGLRLTSMPREVAPGAAADFSLGVFVGPLDRKLIGQEALPGMLNMGRMVVHNFGGPCGWCTFDWLTRMLLWILRTLHDSLLHDWALSIVCLVLIVRTVLHPVTRWSQVRINIFGKQMQAVAPKQKALQEKYKDDPKKFQQEMARLWREEGISPAGFLGCLPAFLQSPVWIALSATLFFAVELRHQPALYGVFQSIQPASMPTWWFMGNLADPDSFIRFESVLVTLPLLGPIRSLNVLPLLLGLVFFLQQKYLSPPTATQMTPEQEMQMKISKWMIVLLFPLMMYNAPAGLALYFLVNSALAIAESKWIRHQMEVSGMLDLDKMRAARAERQRLREAAGKGKPGAQGGGFFSALQKYAEQKQAEAQKAQQRPGQKPGRKP